MAQAAKDVKIAARHAQLDLFRASDSNGDLDRLIEGIGDALAEARTQFEAVGSVSPKQMNLGHFKEYPISTSLIGPGVIRW